jgi:cell division septation protein DedD
VENSAKQKTTDVASANTTDTQPVTQTALPAGTYVIQIASLPSEADARASYNKLAGKFPGIIGGHGVDIKKADIAGKGTYYRVRIPAGSKQEAISLCTKYKAAGGSCLVSR